MREATSQYHSGSPIGAKTKIASTITIKQEARPTARMQSRVALGALGDEPVAGLVAGDRLVLGAVVLEHPPQVAEGG